MSVEKLQEKIRRTKNPSVLDLSLRPEVIPAAILQAAEDTCQATELYAKSLLQALKGIVPAVRLSFAHYAIIGKDGLAAFHGLMDAAKADGYYVLVDVPGLYSERQAQYAAQYFLDLPCDGLVVGGYDGSDMLKPYVKLLKEKGKSLFVILRSANRSASQLQDLMTGSRLVHIAAADTVSRLGEGMIGRSGYSQVGGIGSANAADSLKTMRSKYKNMFILVDGYDYSNANAKNCSYAFDKLGHGCAVCACDTIAGAWIEEESADYAACAAAAAERMKKNLTRYITVL